MLTIEQIINHLITTFGYTSYLEIGYTFADQLTGKMPIVHSIGGNFNVTSDQFFKMKKQRYDLIYIDSLHTEEQIDQDIANSLNHLNPNGTILVNNTKPKSEWHQRSHKEFLKDPGEWTGTVWKSIVKLRADPTLQIVTIDTEWGLSLIRRGVQEPREFILEWQVFEKNKNTMLNIISMEEFYKSFSLDKYRYARETDESEVENSDSFGAHLIATCKQKLDYFSELIKDNKHFALVKFHDGEWLTMTTKGGERNSFGYDYSRTIGDDLIRSYIYLLSHPNGYINHWHYNPHTIMVDLIKDFSPNRKMPSKNGPFDQWINDDKFIYCESTVQKLPFIPGQVNFFKTIQQSSRRKIYISNPTMTKILQPVLNIDIVIPTSEYGFYATDDLFYPEKAHVLNQIRYYLTENMIVLFSCGLGAKIMITDLLKTHPNNVFIDIGSTFDGLFRATRDYNCVPNYRNILLETYQQ